MNPFLSLSIWFQFGRRSEKREAWVGGEKRERGGMGRRFSLNILSI